MSAKPRAGVIGARRRRNGLGPWIARALDRAGCDVVAVSGSSLGTAEQACAELDALAGLACRAFPDERALLADADLDVVAVCSPTPLHRRALELALEHGVHVLAEKPLWWSAEPGGVDASVGDEVRELAQAFADAGLALTLNTQWPCTLAAFDALHPGARGGPPATFEMWMGPSRAGPEMVVDSLPHILSMLEALTELRDVCAIEPRWADDREHLDLAFDAEHAAGRTRVAVSLDVVPEPPRPAGYALDGARAERRIRMPEYRMSFQDGERLVELPDPLDRHVADFVAGIERGVTADVDALERSMVLLHALVTASIDAAERAPTPR